MTNQTTPTRRAALIAGLAILVMAISAPIAEFFIYAKLIIPGKAAETIKNIIEHEQLFRFGIFTYLVTFTCDIVAAWALYIFLKPVNKNVSILTAWFRLVYTIMALAALINLRTVISLLKTPEYSTLFLPDQLNAQVMILLGTFRKGWTLGLAFFGIHLVLLGYLVFKSEYVPKILSLFLFLAGLGYLLNGIQPLLFPTVNIDFAVYTFFGELIFMLWLLIKGSRIKEPNPSIA